MKCTKLLVSALAILACASGAQVRQDAPQGRRLVPTNWWESAAAISRVNFGRQFPLDPEKAEPMVDQLKARGISAIEFFAPYHGGRSYGGLDTINHFNVNTNFGTMDDFRALVRLIHSKGMAVITFDNLGYCSSEAPEFLKACDDVKAGKDTPEARRFLWADGADAPPPGPAGDKYFKRWSRQFPYRAEDAGEGSEFWEYNERAGKFFWTKWLGPNLAGKVVRLPQYNWSSAELREQMEKAVRFWMDQGLDGMVIDAVNWYAGHTWEQDRRHITDVIASYGNVYLQPEGGGAFSEDPVGWIQDGRWNSVQDYGLEIGWENKHVIRTAVDTGDPRPLEQALRDYHDRVVAAGGVLYYAGGGGGRGQTNSAKTRLQRAISASIGEVLSLGGGSAPSDDEFVWLLKTKAAHPARHNLSTRRHLPTAADDKHYAFLRTAKDGSERILAVMNFQPIPQKVEVDLSGVAAGTLVELTSGESVSRRNPLPVELPAYGYRFYHVK